MRTVESVGATFATCPSTRRIASDEPTISSNIRSRSNFFPQRDVFVPRPILSALAIVDVRSGRIPSRQVSLVVAEGVVTIEEPAILAIFSPRETSLGTYQGLDEQVYLPKSPGSFRTVLVPRGSSKPEWLAS